MCGRFVTNSTVKDYFPDLFDEPLADNFNVAPTDDVTVVRERKGGREAPTVRWGFVPSWAKSIKQRPQPINARIETVATSGMFRKSMTSGRCIVPAAGYYEWTVMGDGSKQPHFIHEPDGALAMAGLVTAWPDPSKEADDPKRWLLSMAIITRDAHVAPGEVHDRMPACLTPDAFDGWLDMGLDADGALQLLDRESVDVAHRLAHFPVSSDVNSVRNNGARLIEPI